MAKQWTFSEQLRAAITAADKSMGQIARESGVDIATISRFMHGKGGLSVDGLGRIVESLGLTLTAATKDKSKKG
jgi:transcriptional regulator with XRE-family HTH domain